jgi:hypothetical protein
MKKVIIIFNDNSVPPFNKELRNGDVQTLLLQISLGQQYFTFAQIVSISIESLPDVVAE